MAVIRSAYRLLDRRGRVAVIASIAPTIVVALLEGFALALLFPIIEVIADGDTSEANESLGLVSTIFGTTDPDATLATAAILVVGLLLTKTIVGAIFTWIFLGAMSNAEARLATGLFDRFVRAPVSFHRRNNSADALRSLDSSINSIVRSILTPATLAAGDVAVLAVIAVVLLLADPIVSIITGSYLLIASAALVASLSGSTRNLGRKTQRLSSALIRQVQEGIAGLKTIQSMSLEPYFQSGFGDITDELQPLRRRNSFYKVLPRFYLEAMLVIGAIVVAVAASTIIGGQAALAYVGLLIAAALRALEPASRIVAAVNSVRIASAGVTIVNQTIADLDQAERHARSNITAGEGMALHSNAELILRNVGHVYENGRRALEHVDLDIPRGDSIAFVGASGGGKSTLAAILAGLLNPTEGFVAIDGQPIGPRSDRYKSRVGFVPQSPFLTDETLRNNVAFGLDDDQVEDERVIRALHEAGLGTFLDTLPEGLNTSFGDGGIQLSGGQRQRIVIARALYRQPSILVLDEATAALDHETEAQITDLIDSLAGDRTVIRIAHRIATTRRCRRIVVLHEGQIAGIGSYEELNSTNEAFRLLARLEQAA